MISKNKKEKWTVLSPLNENSPFAIAEYSGTSFSLREQYTIQLGFGQCYDKLRLSYDIDGKGMKFYKESLGYQKEYFSGLLRIEVPKRDTIHINAYQDGKLLGSFSYLFDKDTYMDKYLDYMGFPTIDCWRHTSDPSKVSCIKSKESDKEQFNQFKSIYFGYKIDDVNHSIETSEFLEKGLLEFNTPTRNIYYRYVNKNRVLSGILRANIVN